MKFKHNLRLQFLLAFAITTLVLVFIFGINWKIASQSNETAKGVQRSLALLHHVSQIEANTANAELAARNFRNTGEAVYLSERDKAVTTREKTMGELRLLIQDSPSALQSWEQISTAIKERVALLKLLQNLREAQGPEAAEAYLLQTNSVNESRMRLQKAFNELRASTLTKLEEGNESQQSTYSSFQITSTLVGVGLVLFIWIVYVVLLKQVAWIVQNRQALKVSNARLGAILGSVSDGIIVINEDGVIETFNASAKAMYGYNDTEVIGRNIKILMADVDFSQIEGNLRHYRVGGDTTVIGIEHEVMAKRKDSSLFPMKIDVSEMRIMDKNYFSVIVRDISTQKSVEEALITAREAADQSNQAKSDFLSSMSHELRTPLNSILGFGQYMSSDASLSEENKDCLKEINKAGHHLLALINEVLDLVVVESGRTSLSLEPVELAGLISDCVAMTRTLADMRNVQLLPGDCTGRVVRADNTRLRQALINLISNAIKYNRHNGQVRIEVKPEGESQLRISVTDTGMGIPAHRMSELFQPFSRLSAQSSEIEGTGIGLTITRRVIEQMGGAVNVASEVGVGSTFWIDLPIDTLIEIEPLVETDNTFVAPEFTSSAARRYTVLYIEDNPANIKLMAKLLGRHPHLKLISAHNPELGLELARTQRPDLVLLDINMPGMDGFQILEKFKLNVRMRAVPVIAVTAAALPADIRRGKEAGFNDYVTKPIDEAHFMAILENYVPCTAPAST